MQVTIIPVTPFQQNSTILQCERTNRAAIVDPGGDLDRIMDQVEALGTTLVHSIKNRLWPLGDDVQFVPGHGPVSTFGHERKTNPFVGDHVGY